MIYEYFCECGNVEEINMKMDCEHPKEVVCSKCEGKAVRKFKVSPIVPDHMKATTDNTIRYDKRSQIHGRKYF